MTNRDRMIGFAVSVLVLVAACSKGGAEGRPQVPVEELPIVEVSYAMSSEDAGFATGTKIDCDGQKMTIAPFESFKVVSAMPWVYYSTWKSFLCEVLDNDKDRLAAFMRRADGRILVFRIGELRHTSGKVAGLLPGIPLVPPGGFDSESWARLEKYLSKVLK